MPRRHLENTQGWFGRYASGASRAMQRAAIRATVANAASKRVSDVTNRQARQRERNIARAYFSQSPTISNLYNGAKHFVNSVLTPNNDEYAVNYNTGVVPTPNSVSGKIGQAKQAISAATRLKNMFNFVRDAGTGANVVRTVEQAPSVARSAVQLKRKVTPSEVTQNVAPTITKQVYSTPSTRRMLRYMSPTTQSGVNMRAKIFDDFLNTGNTDKLATIVAKENHVPKKVIKDLLPDYVNNEGRFNAALDLGYNPGFKSRTLQNVVRSHFKDIINRTGRRDAVVDQFRQAGFYPTLNQVADYMAKGHSIRNATSKAVNDSYNSIDAVLGAYDKEKVLLNNPYAAAFMRKFGLTKNKHLSDLDDRIQANGTFDEYARSVEEYLKREGINTRELGKLLDLNKEDLARDWRKYNDAEMNFISGDGEPLHPDFRRGDHTPREMYKIIEDRIKEAIPKQFGVSEQAGYNFSADSFPLILNAAGDLSKARSAAGMYPGRITPRGGGRYGNDFANVNLGTMENPRIGSIFGKTPTPDEIRKFMNRTQAANRINRKLAEVYKIMMRNNPNTQRFDEAMLDAVIKAKGDISKVPGAKGATFSDKNTPLWAEFPEHSDAPLYPNIKFNFRNGGIHIDPANRGALTETMRRTGKTKYQLAHSRNPLTRMRAQFAINASHWNHG